jgi:hypothetical protein
MAIAALMIPQCEIAHSLALDKSASRNPIQYELTFEQAVKAAKDFLTPAKDQETDFTEQLARYSGAIIIILHPTKSQTFTVQDSMLNKLLIVFTTVFPHGRHGRDQLPGHRMSGI